MRYTILPFTIVFILSQQLSAQYHKSIRVPAGSDIAQTYSPNGFYRFAQFSTGTLFSKKKSGTSVMTFNYNLLDDKMQFINNKDTLDMVNPNLFDSIIIDNRVFYYRDELGFVELITAVYPIRLLKHTVIKIKPEVVGGYGAGSTTSAVSRISTYNFNNHVYSFKMNENVIIKETVNWYWTNENGSLWKASKKNLLSLLPPDKRVKATEEIKTQKTDFDKESDIVRLLESL